MKPLQFVFGLHLHQPVGNFDHVFAEHVERVYRPLLSRMAEREFFPVVLHLSGPLLEWLEAHEPGYVDLIGRLAADGKVELLAAGWYEPVLAALLRRDRIEQIQWMRQALRTRFGVDARSLWLTERVWSPELVADLSDAGIRAALVDDRHFLVTGFERDRLHAPIWTEGDDRRLALFPIDERLRYLIPFRPPSETADYLRALHAAGHRLAVLADDGEKFGGWPGTHEWVYERGWLAQFLDAMEQLRASGTVRLATLDTALREVPSGGLAYLPTASYREMEGWSLTPDAALRLQGIERDLGEERMAGPDGALVRGAHWRNFLAKYPESNRMHKKAQRLSILCRERGDPEPARRAIGRAQCNDAYWHGVFGGLYLPHLREGVWRNLADAEGMLRRGEPIGWEILDLDADGHDEIWIHCARYSAIVSPRRGGAVEELTDFDVRCNYADVLTRRREAYHQAALEASDAQADSGGAPSIHDIERGLHLDELPAVDADDRALLQERIMPPGVSWVRTPMRFSVSARENLVEIALEGGDGPTRLEKRIRFGADGVVTVDYGWDPAAGGPGASFTAEVSLSRPLDLSATPAAERSEYPIETVAKSERGLDRTRQGDSVTFAWPITAGAASLRLALPAGTPATVSPATASPAPDATPSAGSTGPS
jgi:hypothetical protein